MMWRDEIRKNIKKKQDKKRAHETKEPSLSSSVGMFGLNVWQNFNVWPSCSFQSLHLIGWMLSVHQTQ